MTTHGHSRNIGTAEHRTYKVWTSMLQRCLNPNSQKFGRYGARGIRVADEWREFARFLSDMGAQPAGLTLERNDNEGDYRKENCAWATQKAQSHNRSTTHNLTHNGTTRCVSEWARQIGVSVQTLHSRLRSGWTVEEALTRPKRGR